MDLHTGAVPGDEVVPDGSMKRLMEVTMMRDRQRVCQRGISDGQEEGVNRGGFFYSDQRSTVEKGGSKVPAGEVGRGGVGVAVTRQRDNDQEDRGRGMGDGGWGMGDGGWGMGGGRNSEHLRRPNRVTVTDAFPNV